MTDEEKEAFAKKYRIIKTYSLEDTLSKDDYYTYFEFDINM